jgi:hypothetical protein
MSCAAEHVPDMVGCLDPVEDVLFSGEEGEEKLELDVAIWSGLRHTFFPQ